MIDPAELDLLKRALDRLAAGFTDLPAFKQAFDTEQAAEVLLRTAERMQDNYPYHHPLYAGQMLKPPDPVARIAYMLSLWINPNNHALDGGRASSAMEKECIARLGRLFGWEDALGHLTGGGTMANLEALWVAGRLNPGKRILASAQAHYTHARISDVLGLSFAEVRTDDYGRMDPAHAGELMRSGDVGTIVATIGTTGLGAVDPLPELLDLAEHHGVRVHADAAYGGYFGLASGLSAPARAAFDVLDRVDSLVIDPHKHGLQPYGCGCVLFRDPGVGRIYQHDSPYTYFSSADLHLGEISLECSRPGAAAVALWATMDRYPVEPGGEFAAMLDSCLEAARSMHARLDASSAYRAMVPPELDIVVFAPAAGTASETSARSRAVFEAAAKKDLHLALINLPATLVERWLPGLEIDTDPIACLRSVLMKPGHRAWVDRIVGILDSL